MLQILQNRKSKKWFTGTGVRVAVCFLVMLCIVTSVASASDAVAADKKKAISKTQVDKPVEKQKSKQHAERSYTVKDKERLQRDLAEFMEWLAVNYPEKTERLKATEGKDVNLYVRSIKVESKRYGGAFDAERKGNAELSTALRNSVDTQGKIDRLLKTLANPKAKNRQKTLNNLKSLVSQRFDAILKVKQLQYESLQKRLKRLEELVGIRQAELEKLKDTKNDAIKQRLKDLLGNDEKIKWD
jgi:uncharacterized phage infection (PIP) family protein YhgE